MRTICTEGFNRIVTSLVTPVATGRSESCRRDSHRLKDSAFAWRTKYPG